MTVVMTMVTTAPSGANRSLPRDQLRERIFVAAIELFRQAGYDATTVDAIARRAGVAKGTVFNFFATKGAILLAHYESLDAQFGRAMLALDPADPRAALADFYGRAESLPRREGALVDAILREIAVDATLRRVDRASGVRDRERLAAYFRRCQARGTVDAQVDPVVAGQAVADLWSATAQDWVRSGRRTSLERRLAAKLDVLFAGLAPGRRHRRGRHER